MSLPLKVLVAIIIITSFFIIAVITFTVCYLAKKHRGRKRYRVMIPVLDFNHSQSNEEKTYYPKDSKRKSRRHGAYQQIHDPKYAVYDSPDELDESDYYSVSDAAEKAKKEIGNLLRTSKGKVYTSTPESTHAVIKFCNDKTLLPSSTTGLWIKKSPCSSCSTRLRQYFKYSAKPTLQIGCISHPHYPDYDNGLIQLIKDGFTVTSWDLDLAENEKGCNVTEYINNLIKSKP